MSLLHNLAQTIPTTDSSGRRIIPLIPLTQVQLGQILGTVFIVIGAMAVMFILVGAARYAASNGEQSKITQAKNTILYAVIGIVVSLSAFTIVQFTLGAAQ